jgi:hypothetical protein
MSEVNMGTLYDFNKNAMASFEPIDVIQFNRMLNSISDAMINASEYYDRHYWMLLCHDRRDFTLFNIIATSDLKDIIDELKPTLENRGIVLDIEWQDTGAYEIWIRDTETQENFAYYLFPYDEGVIEVNN